MNALSPQLQQLLQQGGFFGQPMQQMQPRGGLGGAAPERVRSGAPLGGAEIDAINQQHLGLMPTDAAGWSNPEYWGETNFGGFTDALRGIVGQDFGFDFSTKVGADGAEFGSGDKEKFTAGINTHLGTLNPEQQQTFVGRLGDWGKTFGASGFQPQGPETQWWQGQMQQWQQPQQPPQVPVQGLAQGGPLNPYGINIVGEQGPEAVIGNTVVPLPTANLSPGGMLGAGQQAAQPPGSAPQPQRQPSAQPTQQGQPAQPQQPPSQPGVTNQSQPTQQPQGAFGPTLQNLLGGNFGGMGFGQPQMPQQVSDWLSQQLAGNVDYAMKNITSSFPSVFNSASPQLAGDILGRMVADAGAQTSQAALQAIGLDTDRNRAVTERGLGVGGLGAQMTGLGLQEQLGFGQLAHQQQQFNQTYGLQQQQQAFNQMLQMLLPWIAGLFEAGTPTGKQTVVS